MANRTQIQTALQKPYDTILFGKEVLNPVFGSLFTLSSTPVPASVQPNKSEQAVIQSVFIYGTINLEDGTEITCYEIYLQPSVRIEHSKVAIQRYVRKLLTAGQIALVNFISPQNKGVWRLTLIAKDSELTEDGIKEKTTHAKRFTYLLGPSETGKTAAERFESLSTERRLTFQALVNAFSVERLSNEFFDEYTLHYQKFCDYLQESNFRKTVFKISNPAIATKEEKDKALKPIRDFVKKLLGRIVFLYFVQKKGWLGASDTTYKDGQTNFIKLMFKQSEGDETFYSNWLTALFFETLNKERADDDFQMPNGKTVKVPFLNGGLFDKEDFDEHILTFPSKLFHHPDFEEAILTEKNWHNARGFLDFLDAFNFTVHEDSPDDHTVAVDPEMLGHIFENLLEDNKDKGAFYTPKEVVHYMCQESLIEYLTTNLSKEYTVYKEIGNAQVELFGNDSKTGQLTLVESLGDKALNRDDVAYMVKQKDISGLTKAQVKKIDDLLDNVKICDPAIGSGAFPMGLLQEIHAIKEVIAFELQQPWKPADVKEAIIQNSIYGVDIEKGAVDIARLRFWLSLVVDEEKPRPLPNLDYKIVVGDSLISKFENEIIEIDWEVDEGTQANIFGNEHVLKREKLLETITKKQKQYFHPEGTDKKKLFTEIRILKIEILINQLELMIKTKGLQRKPAVNEKRFKELNEVWVQTEGWEKTISKLQHLKKDKKKPFEYFDWKLDFPEILNPNLITDENQRGFDIVIANPPYGANLSSIEKRFIRKKYLSMEGEFDSYMYFIEKTSDIGKTNSECCFIIPNNLLQQKYGRKLRKLLLDNTTLRIIIDLGLGIFKNAVIPTAILSFKLFPAEKYHKVKCLFRPSLKDLTQTFFEIPQSEFLNNEGFTMNVQVGERDKILMKLLEDESSKLKDVCELKIGIEGSQEYISNSPNNRLSKPLVRGRNFSRYFLDFESDPKYILYDRKLLHRPREERLFDCPKKILIRQTADKIVATIDKKRLYAWKSVFVILSDETRLSLDYLLALLNSSTLNFYYQKIVGEAGRVFAQVKGVNLDKLPIKVISSKSQLPFIQFVQYILFLKSTTGSVVIDQLIPAYFEQIIDGMVYELYLPEIIKKHKREIIEHLGELPELTDKMSDEQKMQICKTVFNRLNDRDHPVRVNLFYMNSIPEIAIIEGKHENN